MTIDQLKSLTDDEMTMLWGIINIVNPTVIRDIQMEPSLFTSINHKTLIKRINGCKHLVKQEHLAVFDGLLNKLTV